MINLEEQHLRRLKAILEKFLPNNTIYLFGSRTTQKIKQYSDIDLAIIDPPNVSIRKLALLDDALAESDIPYKVDLVLWSELNESFRQKILQRYEIII